MTACLSLLKCFFERESDDESMCDDSHELPQESILHLLQNIIARDNCPAILNQLVEHLSNRKHVDYDDIDVLNNAAACFTLLAFTVFNFIVLGANVSHLVRQSLV